jgi:hypothetical protein
MLINWVYFMPIINEDIQNFLRILYNKLRLFLSESYQDFAFYQIYDEEYDFNLEKTIVLAIKNASNHYENVNSFKNFIEMQSNSDVNKFSSFLNHHEIDKTFSFGKKETDMELEEIRTDVSAEHNINNNHSKKFVVFKSELCLKNPPPFEKIKSKIPFLREFQMKFTKRENIDKKLIRKFRKFLKNYVHRTGTNLQNIEDGDFWRAFINEELYPPMKFRCIEQNRLYEFKSFNTNYMSWVFSNHEANNFYDEFLKEKGEEVYHSIIKRNKRTIDSYPENERNMIYQQLRNYIINLAFIFNVKKTEENSESMPAMTPNSHGDIYEEMLESDLNAFYNGESYYNHKKYIHLILETVSTFLSRRSRK